MLTQVKSMSLLGLNGYIVDVQVDISNGLPSWDIVGLPDTSIKESKQRVRAALKNIGLNFPSRKITINLAPALLKKGGSYFDLPIAIGILANFNKINLDNFKNYIFIGELSLDGSLNKIKGVLPLCIEALKYGFKDIIIPYENRFESSFIKELNVYPAKNLYEVISHLNASNKISPFKLNFNFLLENSSKYTIDFSEVKGQENVKRALEIAAAGNHNCLIIGPPGSGKTMLAQRLPTILPDLTFNEALEINKIHSILDSYSNSNFITSRPFRAPHYSISKSALIGGGKIPKPGEISLAHLGVLYLDELSEFKSDVLEVLRIPLEEKNITLNRSLISLTFPCNFMLIASMNPCPCGYYGSSKKICTCSASEILKYRNKISGPLLDRIDIEVETDNLNYETIHSNRKIETSKEIKIRVTNAKNIQLNRYKNDGILSNSELTNYLIKKYCKLDLESENLLKSAFEKFNFSARANNHILKLARTIADLDNSQNIKFNHLAEAIQYRTLDRKYWS